MALVGIPAADQPGKLAPSSEYRSPTAAAAAALPKAVARRQRERTAGHRGGIARTAAIQGGLDRGAPPLVRTPNCCGTRHAVEQGAAP